MHNGNPNLPVIDLSAYGTDSSLMTIYYVNESLAHNAHHAHNAHSTHNESIVKLHSLGNEDPYPVQVPAYGSKMVENNMLNHLSQRATHDYLTLGGTPSKHKKNDRIKSELSPIQKDEKRFSVKESGTFMQAYCSECDIVIENYNSSVRGSCKICNNLIYYQCKICKKQYATISGIHNHLNYECNSEPQFECPDCDYKAKQKGNLQAHIKRKHMLKKCLGCNGEFQNLVVLRKHQIEECHSKVRLRCNDCSFTCNFITKLKDHIRDEHKARVFCKDCGKKYKNLECFRKHTKVCNKDVKQFVCEFCPYHAKSRNVLLKHLAHVHPKPSAK